MKEEKNPASAAVGETASQVPAGSMTDGVGLNSYTVAVASWERFVPGPSPTYCYRELDPRIRRLGIIVVGCFVFLLSGTNVALMGSVSTVKSYLDTVGLADGSSHSRLLIGVVNSIYWVGVLAGALMVGWFSDRVGRRRALVAFGLYGLIVIPLLTALEGFYWALFLRLLNGIFTGAFDSVGLNWAAESIDARRRGLAIGSQLVCAASGGGIVYFIIFGLTKHAHGTVIWRFPMAFQLVYVLVILGMVYLLPESPRWLAKAGYQHEARDVFALLSSDDAKGVEAGIDIDSMLLSIKQAIEEEKALHVSSSYWTMFTKKDKVHTARRTWTALFVQFATQAMVGVGVVTGYGINIFETGGWDSEIAALLTGVSIFTQAIFGILGAMLSDKIGRRRAMVFGAIICAITLALIGVCGHFVNEYATTDPAKAKAYGTATVALVLFWCAAFGMTWLWCPFVYPSELFTASSRTRGSSVGIIGLATGSFFINMVSPYLFGAIGYITMFLFCGLSFVVAIVCYLFMPETSGKTLEQMDSIYEGQYRSFRTAMPN